MTRAHRAWTPGPWWVDPKSAENPQWENIAILRRSGHVVGGAVYDGDVTPEQVEANARLIAASPELLDGCNALLGLIRLLLGRDDLSAELREVLTTSHRIAEAEAAVAKAVLS